MQMENNADLPIFSLETVSELRKRVDSENKWRILQNKERIRLRNLIKQGQTVRVRPYYEHNHLGINLLKPNGAISNGFVFTPEDSDEIWYPCLDFLNERNEELLKIIHKRLQDPQEIKLLIPRSNSQELSEAVLVFRAQSEGGIPAEGMVLFWNKKTSELNYKIIDREYLNEEIKYQDIKKIEQKLLADGVSNLLINIVDPTKHHEWLALAQLYTLVKNRVAFEEFVQYFDEHKYLSTSLIETITLFLMGYKELKKARRETKNHEHVPLAEFLSATIVEKLNPTTQDEWAEINYLYLLTPNIGKFEELLNSLDQQKAASISLYEVVFSINLGLKKLKNTLEKINSDEAAS